MKLKSLKKIKKVEGLYIPPRTTKVEVLENYYLKAHFANGEIKIFDFNPHLQYPWAKNMQDPDYFAKATVLDWVVSWPNGECLSPQELHENSTPLIP